MTTSAQTHLDGAPLEPAALVEGAEELAGSLGVEGTVDTTASWPVGTGQRSVVADFAGSSSGSIYLSVSEEEAERLTTDVDTATGVLAALIASLGIDPSDLESSGFGPATDAPAVHVVIAGDDRSLGFGVRLGAAAEPAPADATPAVDAASFEPAPFNSGATAADPGPGAPISMLADVDMAVTVELGRTSLPVRELLSLQSGMVVELDRQAGAPIDVLVNGRLIARGEVVVLDEQFGLRITDIVTEGAH